MSTRKKRPAPEEAKRARLPGLIAVGIAIVAIVLFVTLNRMMAPPFPNFGTNSPTGALKGATNQAPANTNTASTNQTSELGTNAEPSEIAATLVNEGNQALARGNAAAAVEKYRKAVEAQPEDEDAHFNLGIALARAGKIPEAKKEYEKALELFPDYAEAHNNLGNILKNEKDYAGAIEHFKKAIVALPENPSAHNNYGTALALQGNVNEAVAHFSEAVRLKPDYLEARVNLANAYMAQNRLDEAAHELDMVLRVNPKFEPAKRAAMNLGKRKR